MKYLLKGGFVADGESRTVFPADVLMIGGRIAAVGQGLSAEDAETLDCGGCVITAGFVDAHVHVESSMVLPRAFGEAILPFGTTAVIADPHEVVNVAGAKGLSLFLEECELSRVDVFVCLPSGVPATPLDTNGGGKFLAEDMRPFLSHPRVVGLGEVMCFADAANGEPEMAAKLALFKGRTVDGHTSGMPDDMLAAYVAAGVKNDHECASKESMFARYDMGMNIYIREGSAARNASDLLDGVKERGLDISRFAFCTDDKHLATIAAEGHISYIASMAIGKGFGWGEIAAMASFNPCRYYGLSDRGNVRAGLRADVVAMREDGTRVELVFKDGELVARSQKLVSKNTKRDDKHAVFENTVHLKDIPPEAFVLPERLKKTGIGLVDGQLLTVKEEFESEQLSEGEDLLATAERHGKNGNLAVCRLKGYGIRGGAIATSVSHDSHNAVCAGDNGRDMSIALARLREIGGGYVIVSEGKVAGELSMPAFGLMATGDAEEVSAAIARLEEMAHAMGVNKGVDAFTTLSFVALPVIPRMRLLDTGLYDVEEGRFL